MDLPSLNMYMLSKGTGARFWGHWEGGKARVTNAFRFYVEDTVAELGISREGSPVSEQGEEHELVVRQKQRCDRQSISDILGTFLKTFLMRLPGRENTWMASVTGSVFRGV